MEGWKLDGKLDDITKGDKLIGVVKNNKIKLNDIIEGDKLICVVKNNQIRRIRSCHRGSEERVWKKCAWELRGSNYHVEKVNW